MLSKKLRDSLPEGFRYRETGWYNAISGITEKSHRALLLVGLLTAAVASIGYIVIDLIQRDTQYLGYYLFSLAAAVALLVILLKIGRTSTLAVPAIVFLIVGFGITA
ncbi:MAG: hypothetical protein JW843_03245, partial [Candidatus Aminicenantes bacterium]|nr:hypothetical protein [Candidatus Aminicenantes bacterium]